MPYLDGINTYLVVSATALPEYQPPPDEANSNNSAIATRYVECIPNAPYSIFIDVRANTPARLGNVFIFRVLIDGTFYTDSVVSASEESAITGYINGKHDKPLQFPHVMLSANGSEEVVDAELWEGKEVVLQVSQGQVKEWVPDGASVSEGVEMVGGPESILVFTFKYRPRSILKQHLRLIDSEATAKQPWEKSAQVADDSASHPADRDWKKNLRRNRHPDLYCYCEKIRPGQPVVTCDNDKCEIKSYHWDCVELEEEPEYFWLCPECRDTPKEATIEGKTEFLGPFGPPRCGGCII